MVVVLNRIVNTAGAASSINRFVKGAIAICDGAVSPVDKILKLLWLQSKL
jgi:hypothetical protein